MIAFPADLHIDKIAVVIDDRRPAYTCGNNVDTEPTFNTGTHDGLVRTIQPYIRTFGQKQSKPYNNKKQDYKSIKNTTQ